MPYYVLAMVAHMLATAYLMALSPGHLDASCDVIRRHRINNPHGGPFEVPRTGCGWICAGPRRPWCRGGRVRGGKPQRMTGVAVVGSAPNGLAAAVTMARPDSKSTCSRRPPPRRGLRTAELMEPGHFHDICSAAPHGSGLTLFRRFELSGACPGVPELSYGSPLDGGRAALAYRSLDRTVAESGEGAAYRQLMEPLVRRVEGVADLTLNQLLRIPADPLAAAAFGLRALEQGSPLWNARFSQDLAPALLSGVAAHAWRRCPRSPPRAPG